jgi:peptidoglycan hydrolase CwlO-like protein
MIIRTVTSSDNIEKENLSAHVELCNHRYSTIEKSLAELTQEQNDLEAKISSLKYLMLKAIGIATAVLTSSVSIIIIILDRLKI